MLKHGEVNPLNVHDLRKWEHCPPHFEKVFFESRTYDKDILNWIYENLEGRFYLGENFTTDSGTVISRKCAAFEQHQEASYFVLMLDTFNKNQF